MKPRPTETELRIKHDLWSLAGVVYMLLSAILIMVLAINAVPV